jgi:hypothetical protein
MNSAPRIETVEISEAELDNVSGGLNPHVGVVVGPTAISDSDLLAQAGSVKDQVVGAVGQYHQAGVNVSF